MSDENIFDALEALLEAGKYEAALAMVKGARMSSAPSKAALRMRKKRREHRANTVRTDVRTNDAQTCEQPLSPSPSLPSLVPSLSDSPSLSPSDLNPLPLSPELPRARVDFGTVVRMFSEQRCEHGGAKYKPSHVTYTVTCEAVDRLNEEADPAATLLKSLSGFWADEFEQRRGYDFKTWASDVGRWLTAKPIKPATLGRFEPSPDDFAHVEKETA